MLKMNRTQSSAGPVCYKVAGSGRGLEKPFIPQLVLQATSWGPGAELGAEDRPEKRAWPPGGSSLVAHTAQLLKVILKDI